MNEDFSYGKDLYFDVVQTEESYFIIIDQNEWIQLKNKRYNNIYIERLIFYTKI